MLIQQAHPRPALHDWKLTCFQAVVGSLNCAERPLLGGWPMTGEAVLIQSFSLGSDAFAGRAMACTWL